MESAKRTQKEGELIKIGVQIAIRFLAMTFWKLGCLRRKQLGDKLLHIVEKWFLGLL